MFDAGASRRQHARGGSDRVAHPPDPSYGRRSRFVDSGCRVTRRLRRERRRRSRSRPHPGERRRGARHPRPGAARRTARPDPAERHRPRGNRRALRALRDVRHRGQLGPHRTRLRPRPGARRQARRAVRLHPAEVRRPRTGRPGGEVRRRHVGADGQQGAPAGARLRGLLGLRLGDPGRQGQSVRRHEAGRPLRPAGRRRGRQPPAPAAPGPPVDLHGGRPPPVGIQTFPKDSDAQLALRSGKVVADLLTKPTAAGPPRTPTAATPSRSSTTPRPAAATTRHRTASASASSCRSSPRPSARRCSS